MAEKKAIEPKAKSRFDTLSTGRQTALRRARENSDLTIPGLVPQDGQDSNSSFSQPYQSLGARGVNNLASYLLVTQFPPDQHFARLSVHEDAAEELGEKLTEVKTALSRISAKAHLLLETTAARPVMMEALRHLIVAGNALLNVPLEGTPRIFRLDQYVVLRDERGRMLEAVIHERVYPSALDEETLTACKVEVKPGEENTQLVDLYTHVFREGDQYRHYQQINDHIVPNSEGASPMDAPAFIALRWQAVPGSDYGRAHVSEYVGDLMSLEDLSKSIIQFASLASRVVYLVEPNSMTDIEELNEAENGDYVHGYADKVKALQMEKYADFQVASSVAERLELRLSHSFLLQSGTVRNAERVTAEEIRAMAQELENVLGGTYTVLSAELQLPLIKRYLYILQRSGQAPNLPETIKPTIVTGFEALGRNHAATRLNRWLDDMKARYGEQILAQITDPTEVGRRLADSYGIDAVDDLIKSPEVQQEEQQAAASQQAAMSAVPQVAKGVMDGMVAEGGPPIPTGA
ncbi:MAG: phage tail protein [Sphingomonadales bacterium]|nr:phage tail protein [Sphingomonadales bacterium]